MRLLLTHCVAIGYIALGRICQITGDIQPTSLFQILNLLLVTWCLSIGTQVISTGLIAGKIWWHAKRSHVSKSRYISLIAIIIESGAIFTVSTAFLLAFFDLKTQSGGIIADITTQTAVRIDVIFLSSLSDIPSRPLSRCSLSFGSN